MNHSKCLLCNLEIMQEFTWINFIKNVPESVICQKCEQKLEMITGERCSYCSRDLALVPEEFQHDGMCRDCHEWHESGENYLDGNLSLFHYNDFMQELIARIKYRGDYKLLSIFSKYIAIPEGVTCAVAIPLSRQRHQERGFNQATGIAEFANIPITDALTRVHSEKQAKKDRIARIKTEQIFSLCEIDLSEETVLLIDDIYTTGTTLQRAAKVLKDDGGAERVFSLTIGR